jgi:hypothetical protein
LKLRHILLLSIFITISNCSESSIDSKPSNIVANNVILTATSTEKVDPSPTYESTLTSTPTILSTPGPTLEVRKVTRSLSQQELADFIGIEFLPKQPDSVSFEWAWVAFSLNDPRSDEFVIYSVLYQDSRMLWMTEKVGYEVERVITAISPPPPGEGQRIVGHWCGNSYDGDIDPRLIALVNVPEAYEIEEDIEILWFADYSKKEFVKISIDGAYCYPDAFFSTF